MAKRHHRLFGGILSLEELLKFGQVCQALDRLVELLTGFSRRLTLNRVLLAPDFSAIVLIGRLDHVQSKGLLESVFRGSADHRLVFLVEDLELGVFLNESIHLSLIFEAKVTNRVLRK